MTPAVAAFWAEFSRQVGGVDVALFYEASCFGDSESLAEELAGLVLSGRKRATAGALWSFEAEGKRLPRLGDLSVLTTWNGTPLCVIRSTRVQVMPFDAVPAAFAAAEGEGDGSLDFWRRAHRAYFGRECARIGRSFSADMPVCCEHFELVWAPVVDGSQFGLRLNRQSGGPTAAPASARRGPSRWPRCVWPDPCSSGQSAAPCGKALTM
jgi:uncharacterized protein YhfF